MSCICDSYQPLELFRESIDRRIRETRKIRRGLELIAQHPDGEHRLYICRSCKSFWQISRAWNWGNYRYAFQVPDIEIEDWITRPYVQPDDILIFEARMTDFIDRNIFVKTDRPCRSEGCSQFANEYSVFCLEHHIESLQDARALPREPWGRWFSPYR
jgi:hypothetical protein